MSAKPTVVYTRPIYWKRYTSDKLNLVYVPLVGNKPVKKSGKPAGPDGHYLRAQPEGIELLIRTLKKLKPQVFLRWVNTGMTKHTHDRIREVTSNTVMMVADGNEPTQVHRYALRYKNMIDVFLINSKDPEMYRRYREAVGDADTMYDGFDPRDCMKTDLEPKTDCFFAGSNRRSRDKFLKWVWSFPGGEFRFEFISAVQRKFKLRLYGTSREWPMPRNFKVGETLRHPNFFKAFHNAKIVLGACHYPEIPQFYTRRLIHNGASGRLVITRYVKGMEKDFGESGKYIVWFNTIEEGLEKIDYYLKHRDERDVIAARCKAHFLKNHSWKARLRDFEKIVERIL